MLDAAFARANKDGLQVVGAANQHSGPFRAAARRTVLDPAEQARQLAVGMCALEGLDRSGRLAD